MSQTQPKPNRRSAAVAALAPTLLLSVAFPMIAFNVCKSLGMSDLAAYLWASLGPLAETVGTTIVRRHANRISLLILTLTLASAVVTVVGNTSPVVLLLKDSALTGVFGLVCLGSLFIGRPLMFHFAQTFGGAGDPERVAGFDRMWEAYAGFRRTFRIMTVVWGVGYLAEALVKVIAAETLPFGVAYNFNQVSPLVITAVLMAFTFWYGKRAQRKGEALRAAAGTTAQ